MKIGIYANHGVKVSDNGFYLSALNAKYLLDFRTKSSHLILLSSTSDCVISKDDVFISYDDVSLIHLPAFNNYIEAIKYFLNISKGILKLISQSDFIYARTPEPFSWILGVLKKKHQVINYHFVSNPLQVIDADKKNNKIKWLFKRVLFMPEFYMICIASALNKSTANGPSVICNIPFFLKNRIKVVIENTYTKEDFSKKKPVQRTECSLNEINFLCVSRFQAGKGLENLINAFSVVEKKQDNIKMTIVGDGPLFSEIKSLIESKKLADKIALTGFICNGKELDDVYKKHNVFVNPSISETGPRTILEAMSENLYCISTDVGYVKYILTKDNKLYGMLCKPNSILELADAMASVCIDNDRIDIINCSNNGYNMSKVYTLDGFIDSILGRKYEK
ncbi:glycosyltransferase family 4 protein [Photobacterium carnosum]|uniref:glycosyltransferase n=1 Tax=Photobacterium carnosum TaxID=2023717 RepID=UPI001C8FC301|nr:glycosyltransferase [Photobacterium carnosum]MBY3790483.1 glycosyltransferase family 4 protein [Photobacterium carnosum]MCD9535526.1 glycosyltransferase [Photobacterium carnosum]